MLKLQVTLGLPFPFPDGETEAQSFAHIRLGQASFLALSPQHFALLPSSRWRKELAQCGGLWEIVQWSAP